MTKILSHDNIGFILLKDATLNIGPNNQNIIKDGSIGFHENIIRREMDILEDMIILFFPQTPCHMREHKGP